MSRHGATPAGRIAWIDTGRGIAIVLVALFHATNWLEGAGAHPAGWAEANAFVSTLRMPLFFLLAGLFAASWTRRPWSELWRRKLRLFAWLFVLWTGIGTATVLLGLAARGDRVNPLGAVRELLLSPVLPRFELWFIWALALFFVLARLLRSAPAPLLLGATAALSAAAMTDWQALAGGPDLAALNSGWIGIPKYLVFFLLGLYGRRPILDLADRAGPFARVGVVAAWAAASAGQFAGLAAWPGYAFGTALLGLAAGIVVSRWLSRVPVLAFLGARTLPVYLAHTPVIVLLVAALGGPIADAPMAVRVAAPAAIACAAILVALVADALVSGTRLAPLFAVPTTAPHQGGAHARSSARRPAVIPRAEADDEPVHRHAAIGARRSP